MWNTCHSPCIDWQTEWLSCSLLVVPCSHWYLVFACCLGLFCRAFFSQPETDDEFEEHTKTKLDIDTIAHELQQFCDSGEAGGLNCSKWHSLDVFLHLTFDSCILCIYAFTQFGCAVGICAIVHLCVCAFVKLVRCAFVNLLCSCCEFVNLCIYSCVHLLMCAFVNLLMLWKCAFVHVCILLMCAFVHLLMCCCICAFADVLLHWCIWHLTTTLGWIAVPSFLPPLTHSTQPFHPATIQQSRWHCRRWRQPRPHPPFSSSSTFVASAHSRIHGKRRFSCHERFCI